MSASFPIELDREDDGRWIAEIRDLPGTLCYGKNRDEAIARVQAPALRVLAERRPLHAVVRRPANRWTTSPDPNSRAPSSQRRPMFGNPCESDQDRAKRE